MIEADEVEDCRVQIVDRGHVLDRLVAKVVGRAVMEGPLHAGTGQPHGETCGVMVAAIGPLLEGRHPAKLRHEHHQRVGKQATVLEIPEQSGDRLVEDRTVHAVLLLDGLVAVPVAHALAHRVTAVEELHEPHPLLHEPPGEDAVAGKAGLE